MRQHAEPLNRSVTWVDNSRFKPGGTVYYLWDTFPFHENNPRKGPATKLLTVVLGPGAPKVFESSQNVQCQQPATIRAEITKWNRNIVDLFRVYRIISISLDRIPADCLQ